MQILTLSNMGTVNRSISFQKMKSAGYYKTRPGDFDKSFLPVIPDAPRTASMTYPNSWDWDLLKPAGELKRAKKKIPTPIPEVQQEVEEATEDVLTSNDLEKARPKTPISPEVMTHDMLVVENSDHYDDNTEQMDLENEFERDLISENVRMLQ